MPKKSFTINKFNGGINNNSLPRDIDPDELVDCNNYMVDEVGSIRTMGNFSTTQVAASVVSNYTPMANYNLYAYSTDYDEDSGLVSTDWIVYASANASDGMQIIEEATPAEEFEGVLVTGSTTAGTKIIFHNVDGRLYVNDSTFTNASTNQVREFITAVYHPYSEATGATRTIAAWTDYSNITTAPTQRANLTFEDDPASAGSIEQVAVRVDGAGTGTWNITNSNVNGVNFDLFYSYVLRDGSETALKVYTKNNFGNDPNCQLTFTLWYLHLANHSAISTVIPNKYKGIRIYWKQYDTIYDQNHQLLLDIDFEKGYKVGTSTYYTQDYEPFTDEDTIGNVSGDTLDSQAIVGPFANPSDLASVTYEVLNGVTPSDLIGAYRYKTSVVANRRVYLGNVKYDNKVFGDRILKSKVNKFSMFSDKDVVDVTVNDGDEITALESYGDRLLEFKKSKLHIINIAKEFEFLEDTFIGKGCEGPFSVAKTDYGVAWVNEHGCYLYDGRQVRDLLEEKNGKLIKDSTWETFVSTGATIGYSPKNRLLIVFSTSAAAKLMYLYHIPTGSWTRGDASTTDVKSNFIVTKDNRLAVLDKANSGNTISALIRSWNNTSQDHAGSILVIRDIDFGNPSSKKHIKKIVLSYQMVDGFSSASFPALTYDLNGGTTLTSSFVSHDSYVNADFAGVEFIPSAAITDAYSISLKFSGAVDSTFIINDISIIYREKSVR